MAQHDYAIANGSGSAVRSDLNNALAAIVSHNSGTSEPTTTYAYMPWADTSAGVMKLRNGANNAWITLYQLDGEYTTIPLENGTAAAPSLYFKTSGTDTGLYSPGTDQVAISTAGTGRLFVGSDGKVGIGTSSPSQLLTTVGNIKIAGAQASNNAKLCLTRTDTSWSISNETDLRFYRGTGDTDSPSTASVVFTNTGNVGIGTTPAQLLHLKGSGDTKLLLNSANNASDRGIYFATSTDSEVLGYIKQEYTTGQLQISSGTGTYSSEIAFRTSGSERAKIDLSGRLLVGPAGSPAVSLDPGTTGSPFVRDSTGRIGVGTAAPQEEVHVYAATNPYIQFQDSTSYALFGYNSSNQCAGIESQGGIFFGIPGKEAARFSTAGVFTLGGNYSVPAVSLDPGTTGSPLVRDSSGRLLVGTSSARTLDSYGSAGLQVESTGFAQASISALNNQNTADGVALMLGKSRGTSLSSYTVVQSNDQIGGIYFQGADGFVMRTGASIEAHVDSAPGASDMPGRLVFSTTADGASSPTERLRISNNGQLSAVIPGNSTLYPGFMARAWVNFDGTGTVAIRASGNVSSITDNGVGDYTVNFTTAMVDANYAVTQAYTPSSSATYVAQVSTMTASSVRMGSYLDFSNGTNLDQSMVSVAIFR